MHLCAELIAAFWTLEPFGEIGANFSLQLSSRTRFEKLIRKKVIAENQCEKHKKSSLVYKFKRIVGKPNFSDQFKKIVKRYTRVAYNLYIMRQSACLVLNPITVYSYGYLFNCTTVGQASDSMMALT